ncbi:MAG: thiol-activated cytolysin family protein [Saprospiraceae bacterium]
MKVTLRSILTTFLLIGLLATSCKKDKEFDGLRGVMENAGDFEPVENSNEVISSDTEEVEIDGSSWNCTTTTQSVSQGGGGSAGFPLFNPNAGIIFPGNLLQGASLKNATPSTITVARTPGKISTDVVDGNLAPSFEVSEVTKSEVSIAINNIIANSTGVVPANFEFKYENVQSREQFALELGLDVSTAFTDFEANVSFSNDQSYNRYYVSLNQSYYTMSFDEPISPESVFDESVTASDLERFISPGNPATYISDVTYGRIYYMLIESTSSITEMDAQINASFNGVVNTVDGSIDASYLSTLDDLKIQVFAFGGSAQETLQTIGQTNLNSLVDLLAESSDITTGKPISYVVKSLYDNKIVSVQLATQYDVTNCVPTGADGAPPYTAHWTGEVVSRMGPVGAAYNPQGTEIILISMDGQQWMRSNTGILEGPFPISELGVEDCPLAGGIGAACNIEGNANGDFYLMAFDMSGVNYAYMNPSGSWGELHPVSQLALGDNPFNLTGVGAMAFRYKDPNGPAQRYMWNGQGTHYSKYTNNPNSFGSTYSNYYWGPDGSHPFLEVGAATGFYIGNNLYYLIFDKQGTKYTIYGSIDGGGDRFGGVFPL